MAERLLRRRKGFTIIELMVSVMILTIIVALSTVGYTRYRDKAAMLVDETNLKVILAGLKLSAYDNNVLPGSLSELDSRYLERAYALVTEGKHPYTFFAFLQEQLGLRDIAEAVPLDKRYLGDNPLRVLTCPTDGTKPEQYPNPTKHSYGITTGEPDGAANKSLSWLLLPTNAVKIVIAESDGPNPSPAGTEFARRHKGDTTCVQISAAGIVSRNPP